MATAGYSITSLAKKLGLKSGMIIRLINEPAHYLGLFDYWPENLTINEDPSIKKDFIHFFTTSAKALEIALPVLHKEIKNEGMLWLSWPKQSAKTETDLNGNIVRSLGLLQGLVDVKVCAIDNTWSGLKFVIRREDRK